MNKVMGIWHSTLNEALAAHHEGHKLVELWPIGENVNYGKTARVHVEDGNKTRYISVYRDGRGMYETAISYITD